MADGQLVVLFDDLVERQILQQKDIQIRQQFFVQIDGLYGKWRSVIVAEYVDVIHLGLFLILKNSLQFIRYI